MSYYQKHTCLEKNILCNLKHL